MWYPRWPMGEALPILMSSLTFPSRSWPNLPSSMACEVVAQGHMSRVSSVNHRVSHFPSSPDPPLKHSPSPRLFSWRQAFLSPFRGWLWTARRIDPPAWVISPSAAALCQLPRYPLTSPHFARHGCLREVWEGVRTCDSRGALDRKDADVFPKARLSWRAGSHDRKHSGGHCQCY